MNSPRFLHVLLASVCVGLVSGQTTTRHAADQWEVPVTRQEPNCPPEGWCGESSIQMACMYYGCYFPQKLINTVGHPSHPDLWSKDLAGALDALGFGRRDLPTSSAEDFIRALKPELNNGVPVILGVNVYSGNQGGAHFCIAAKCDNDNLTINTTWSMTSNTFSWSKLRTKSGGITLADVFMGLAIPAPDVLAAHRLRLYPADPASFFTKKCKLRMMGSRLINGEKYQIRSYASIKLADQNRGAGDLVGDFTASGTEYSQVVEVDRDQSIVFVLTHVRQ